MLLPQAEEAKDHSCAAREGLAQKLAGHVGALRILDNWVVDHGNPSAHNEGRTMGLYPGAFRNPAFPQ